MVYKSIELTVIDVPDKNASILQTTSGVPHFTGEEHVDLLCGRCGAAIGRGVSLETIAKTFAVPAQFLAQCKCGAHNRLFSPNTN